MLMMPAAPKLGFRPGKAEPPLGVANWPLSPLVGLPRPLLAKSKMVAGRFSMIWPVESLIVHCAIAWSMVLAPQKARVLATAAWAAATLRVRVAPTRFKSCVSAE